MATRHALGVLIGAVLPVTMALAEQKPKGGEEQVVIGFSLPLLGYPMMADMKEAAEAEAEALGVKLVVTDAHFAVTTQARDVEGLVQERVDGILINPMPFGSVTPQIDAAVAAGVPVVKVLAVEGKDKAIATFGTDLEEGGRMAARFVIEKLGGKGSVLVIEGTNGFGSEFKAAFEEGLKGSKVKVIASASADLFKPQAKRAMATLIDQNPRFDAVLGVNDTLALGAMEALIDAEIDPSKKVLVGWDATPEAIDAVQRGMLAATVSQQVGEQTRQGLRCLVDYVRTKKAPAARHVLIAPKLITKTSVGSR